MCCSLGPYFIDGSISPPPMPACRAGAKVFCVRRTSPRNFVPPISFRADGTNSTDKTASPVGQAHDGVKSMQGESVECGCVELRILHHAPAQVSIQELLNVSRHDGMKAILQVLGARVFDALIGM